MLEIAQNWENQLSICRITILDSLMGHWFRSANSANQINGNSLLSSTIHAVLTTLLAFYIVFIDEKAKGLIFIKIQSIITIVQNNDYCGLF